MALFKFRWPGKKDDAEPEAGAKRPSRLAQGESVEAMRRRARHRLIGAAVLVLAGVIGFPLLFDTQPRPIPVNVPIQIPDQANAAPEVVSGSQTSGSASAPTGRVAANASLDDGEEVLPSSPRSSPASVSSAPPSMAPVVTAAAGAVGAAVVASQAKPVAKPEPKPEVKPKPEPKPKPEVKPEAKPEPKLEAKTEPKPESKPEVKPERKPEPKPEKPKAEPKKPEDKSKHKPDNNKADDAARARALLEGRSAPEPAAAKEASATHERFMVQIGAFAEVSKANEIKGKLGGGAFTQTVDTKDGKRTRVRMGPYKSREEAEKAAARAKAQGLPASVFKG
jgi:DedD protein